MAKRNCAMLPPGEIKAEISSRCALLTQIAGSSHG